MASSISICRACLTRPSTLVGGAPRLLRPTSDIHRLLPATSTIPSLIATSTFSTTASLPAGGGAVNRAKLKSSKLKQVKKKKPKTHFKIWNHAELPKYALTDAMRYIRAFEVGNDVRQAKYDLAVKIYTQKNGPAVKSRIQLPKAVNTDIRICVFADGKKADAAREAGAVVVGTKDVWEQIKEGVINFDRVICASDVFQEFQKTGLGRVLGPRGMMPSPRTGTVVTNPAAIISAMIGASDYRERQGVVRIAIGQLGFSPDELRDNIKVFMDQLAKDLARIEDFDKRINEVVLSSTHSPAFSLSGEFRNIGREEDLEITPEVVEGAAAAEEAPAAATL
ncbi:mitochondrial 54S ribosomal protein mrpl1 [Orbilia oligospora]|uniref:Mitochondrial 54S ribosomal protein mrpl1 n=1 Tax=Orbilia oligospora TaxID=2813651 RepID=A0A7C8PLR2_ORBOL|nr:mitochondrial 54S ribosomal protein mrpl1 [Orbilia oligospora]KAF3288129.1 mitochondrial 54S ribosomal protein mrpl1 [Orbilia oligospora]TGJ63472.1 mitochondrial 54S ribosomal protein mrpl1 [Orbilia oligospora]